MDTRGIGFLLSVNDRGTEKVSVNMNPATLSSIDLLVDSGYYSNRSDFINQAVREAIARQQSTIDRVAEQSMDLHARGGSRWFLGAYFLTRSELEECASNETRISITGYGVLRIAPDCEDEMVFKWVKAINVRGRVTASAAVKAYYELK